MLNGAWPKLHWQLFDFYLRPAGAYFGLKKASQVEHVAYNYNNTGVYLTNQGLESQAKRTVTIDLIDTRGKSISHKKIRTETHPNSAKYLAPVPKRDQIKDVGFVRLLLEDAQGQLLDRNVHWLSKADDVMDWNTTNSYTTFVTNYSDFTCLQNLAPAKMQAKLTPRKGEAALVLENTSDVPAFFIRLNLLDGKDAEITPVYWSDNYVTLFPNEKLHLDVRFDRKHGRDVQVKLDGYNVKASTIKS